MCDVDWWAVVECNLWSLVRSPVGVDHGIHCWWDLISRNSCPVFLYVTGFSGRGNLIHNIILYYLKKKIMHIYILTLEVIIIMQSVFPILLWRRGPGSVRVLCKEYGYNLPGHLQVNWPRNYPDKLVWHHLCTMWIDGSVVEFRLCILWSLVDLQNWRSRYTLLMKPNELSVFPYVAHKFSANFRSW